MDMYYYKNAQGTHSILMVLLIGQSIDKFRNKDNLARGDRSASSM